MMLLARIISHILTSGHGVVHDMALHLDENESVGAKFKGRIYYSLIDPGSRSWYN